MTFDASRVCEVEPPSQEAPLGVDSPFGPDRKGAQPALAIEPVYPDDQRYDFDDYAVPPRWALRNWNKLAHPVRRKLSREYVAGLSKAPKITRAGTPGATTYTTKYAIAEGRRRGWVLVDRENYDWKTKRHHDLQLGIDVLFDDGHGLIGVQGAGRSERAPHYQRFLDRGGPEKAKRRHIRILYWEFQRGESSPVKEEVWA